MKVEDRARVAAAFGAMRRERHRDTAALVRRRGGPTGSYGDFDLIEIEVH